MVSEACGELRRADRGDRPQESSCIRRCTRHKYKRGGNRWGRRLAFRLHPDSYDKTNNAVRHQHQHVSQGNLPSTKTIHDQLLVSLKHHYNRRSGNASPQIGLSGENWRGRYWGNLAKKDERMSHELTRAQPQTYSGPFPECWLFSAFRMASTSARSWEPSSRFRCDQISAGNKIRPRSS